MYVDKHKNIYLHKYIPSNLVSPITRTCQEPCALSGHGDPRHEATNLDLFVCDRERERVCVCVCDRQR